MRMNHDDPEGQKPPPEDLNVFPQTLMNLTLLDPPRWGWSAVGGVADLLTPHERSHRRSTCISYRKQRRRNTSTGSTPIIRIDSSVSKATSPPISKYVATVNPPAQKQSEETTCASEFPPTQPSAPPGAAAAVEQIGESSFENPQVASALSTNQADNNNLEKIGQETDSKRRANGLKKPEYYAKLGIDSELLGMHIVRGERTTGNKEISKIQFQCTVNPLEGDILDMYSYHRGREGMEPRDCDSGELLCPLEPTDTNYDLDAPKLVATVVIEFPLEDGGESSKTAGEMESIDKAVYKQTLQWDLSDPCTPSPLAFANDVANEYGLSFGQRMDLAVSIEQQIELHLQQNCNFRAPLTSKDPLGNERRFAGSTIYTHRYDQVLQTSEGGIRQQRKQNSRQSRAPTESSRQRANQSTGGGSANSRRGSLGRVTYEKVVVGEPEEEVEPEYIEETKRRTRAASVLDVGRKCKNGSIGAMEKHSDFHCHICHKRCKVTYSFACGAANHAYCAMHCKTRFGIEPEPNGLCVFQYCPVCSLLCSCSKCRRKLETVAREFKRECENQGAKLQDTKCHDILERCEKAVSGRGVTVVRRIREEKDEEGEEPSPPMPEKVSKPRKSVGSRPQQRQVRMVPKPPLSAFPREVCGLAEIEPGTPGDYLTVYTSNGSYLVDGFPEAWKQQDRVVEKAGPLPASDGEPSEDGNVDFCQICITPGNLVCCDFCPRAFHPDCIKSGDQSTSDEHWECFVCKKERAGLEGDVVDGNKSFDLISASFLDVDASDEKSLNGMRVLSMIHEMLGKLMEYDFGYMFMKPVDCEAVPGYKDIVKHPMDLGTICSKLINGGYSNILKENNSFDDVIVEVLKAVELVWHNCYIFNFGGSAIYRMAVVQSRRAKAICERSFNNLLSDEVKVALQDYHRACELERGQSSSQNHFSASPEEKALRAQRPKSKHKITIQSFNPSVSRPVAILDPVSGRMVKIFSTLKTAAQAAQMLLELGHPCEYDLGHDVNMKSIAKRSAADPSILLFGYRWLMLHALRTGKVKFLRPSADFVEMHHNSCTYAFLSIDEAVSFPDLPKKTKLDELRERLAAASRGLEWIEISGRKWRRPEIPKEAKDPERKNVKESKKNGSSSLLGSTSQSRSPYLEHETYFLKNSAVVKEDLVTCRKLIGYENVPAAYEDWMLTIVSSPTFPESEARSMENFQKYYLDGDRNIDGIVWRSLKAVAPCSNEKQETKQEVCLGNRQTGDISAPKDSAADVSTEQQAKEAAPGSEAISDVKDSSIKVTVSGNGSNTMQVDTSDDIVDKLGADSPSALGKRKRLDVEVPLEESAEQLSVSADKNSKKLNLGEQNQKVGKDALVVTGNPTPEPLCERQAPS